MSRFYDIPQDGFTAKAFEKREGEDMKRPCIRAVRLQLAPRF